MFSTLDEKYMKRAIELAKKAADIGEVPVGAVAVWEDDEKRNIISEIVGEGYNRRESDKNALCHAELIAINEACSHLSGWRLHKCTLYVTLEPCPMCAGAIVNSRIKRVVFGAKDSRFGAMGGSFDMLSNDLNHKPTVESGLFSDECEELMKEFFKKLRSR